jgi:hypothetical protein
MLGMAESFNVPRQQLATMLTPEMFGDPAATADAIFKAVDADEPPLHLVLGAVVPDDSPSLLGPSGLLGEMGSSVERCTGHAYLTAKGATTLWGSHRLGPRLGYGPSSRPARRYPT